MREASGGGVLNALAHGPKHVLVAEQRNRPLRQIAENAGLEGSVVINEVRKAKKSHGLNAATGEISDLVAAGVIDPAMVTRSATRPRSRSTSSRPSRSSPEMPEKESLKARSLVTEM
jgi:chaperonin GroEL